MTNVNSLHSSSQIKLQARQDLPSCVDSSFDGKAADGTPHTIVEWTFQDFGQRRVVERAYCGLNNTPASARVTARPGLRSSDLGLLT